MQRALLIALAVAVFFAMAPLFFGGVEVKTPPITQTARQESHVIGFFVINSGNQTIQQGVYPRPDAGGDIALTIGLLLLASGLVIVVAALGWRFVTGGGRRL
jgi:hypothetical protein